MGAKKTSNKNKSLFGAVLASLVLLFLSGVPQEQFRSWKKSLGIGVAEVAPAAAGDDLAKLAADIQRFGDWIKGVEGADILVVRPGMFEIHCGSPNPAYQSTLEFRISRIEGDERLTEADLGRRIALHCNPASVTARLKSIQESGPGVWRIQVDGVSGKGNVGVSIDGGLPTFFDVYLNKIWAVPIRAVTEDLVFVGRESKGLRVGELILSSGEYCGYRVMSINPNCVWFEVFYGQAPEGAMLPTDVWPNFGRVDFRPPVPSTGRLVFRKGRYFWPGEAIRLPSGEYLLHVHELIRPNVAHFRLLGKDYQPIRDLICVVVRPTL